MGRLRIVVFEDKDDFDSNNIIQEITLGRADQDCPFHIPTLLWYEFQPFLQVIKM